MPDEGERIISRRDLLRWTLGTATALASEGILGACSQPAAPTVGAALPPPEITTVRFVSPAPCDPPSALAKEFLLEEGFKDIQYPRAANT
ncbi:MAG TPA: hypothetical protein VGK07_06060, partial [Candidatus Limnocylindria bacterium]